LSFNDIEGTHYDAWLLGHKKLDTTALYTRVALKSLGAVTSPLEHLVTTGKPPA
jgi:integrase/recombinase XerD